MDKQNLEKYKDSIKLITKIVESQLKKILPALVKQEIQNYMRSSIDPFAKPSSQVPLIGDNTSLKMIKNAGKSSEKKIQQKKFSNNPILSKVLNETYYDMMNDESFKQDMNYSEMLQSEYNDMRTLYSSTKNIMPVPEIQKSGNVNEVLKDAIQDGANPNIAKILAKNHSGFAEAISKNKSKTSKYGLEPFTPPTSMDFNKEEGF